MTTTYKFRRGAIELICFVTGLMRCAVCGAKWHSRIRPESGGKYYRGSWTCYQCGADTKTEAA